MKASLILLALAVVLAHCSLTRQPHMMHQWIETDFDYACSRRYSNIPGVGGSICGGLDKDCCKPVWDHGNWRNNTCEKCNWLGGSCCEGKDQNVINDLEYSNVHWKTKTDWFGVYCDDECAFEARNAPNGNYNVQVCDIGMPIGPRKKSCCKFGCSDSAT